MRNIFTITDKYRINNLDDLNWCIQEAVTVKKSKDAERIGTVHWKNVSYHRDLAQACTRLAKTLADETECDTLNDYANALKRHCDGLAAAVGAIQ
jgi:hypothetical protein